MAITLRKFILKRTAIPGGKPSPAFLDFGELAINYKDGIIFYKDSEGIIQSFNGTGTGDLAINSITEAPKDGLVNDYDVRTIKLIGANNNDLHDGDYERLDTTLPNGNVDVRFSFNSFTIFKENDLWVVRSSTPEAFDPYYELRQRGTDEYEYPWDVPYWESVRDGETIPFDLEIISNKGTPGAFGQYAIQASVGGLRLFGDVDQSSVPKGFVTYAGEYNFRPSYVTPNAGTVDNPNTDFRGDFYSVFATGTGEFGFWRVQKGNVSNNGTVTYEDAYNEYWRSEESFAQTLDVYDPSISWVRVGQPYNFYVEPTYTNAVIWQQISSLPSQVKWLLSPSIEDVISAVKTETNRAIDAETEITNELNDTKALIDDKVNKGIILSSEPLISPITITGVTPDLSGLTFYPVDPNEFALPQWSSTGEAINEIQNGWIVHATGTAYGISLVSNGVIQPFSRFFATQPASVTHPDEVTGWVGLGVSGTPVITRNIQYSTLENGQVGVWNGSVYIGTHTAAYKISNDRIKLSTVREDQMLPFGVAGVLANGQVVVGDGIQTPGATQSRTVYSNKVSQITATTNNLLLCSVEMKPHGKYDIYIKGSIVDSTNSGHLSIIAKSVDDGINMNLGLFLRDSDLIDTRRVFSNTGTIQNLRLEVEINGATGNIGVDDLVLLIVEH